MNKLVWEVQADYNSEYLEQILEFLIIEYANIFGMDVMNNERCILYNDPQATCPLLIRNLKPIRIRLAQSSLSYWAQTIFQLSHELCHYAIRQKKEDKNFTLSWFEEIVCEAMSLYALDWSSKHWENCELFLKNIYYRDGIIQYLITELGKKCTQEFRNCTRAEMLQQYDAEENREGHRDERNKLYSEICKDPCLCYCFCDYQKYLNSNKSTIDFEKWEKNDANTLICFMHSLQPCTR